MAVKLFATNRNGAEAVNVLMRDLTIRADRINGLGTVVRTVFDEVVYADPTSIERGVLIVGGPPKPPAIPVPGSARQRLRRRRKGPQPGCRLPAAAAPRGRCCRRTRRPRHPPPPPVTAPVASPSSSLAGCPPVPS